MDARGHPDCNSQERQAHEGPGSRLERELEGASARAGIFGPATDTPTIPYKGNFFFGNLGTFPVAPGTESLVKVTPSGQIQEWARGLTTVLGLAFGTRDRRYALESRTAPGFSLTGSGSARGRSSRSTPTDTRR